MSNENNIEFLCDSHHGKFIPQVMVPRLVEFGWQGLNDIDLSIFEDTDNEWYWEEWDSVLNNAFLEDKDNKIVWRLWQDGDLFTYNDEYIFEDEF